MSMSSVPLQSGAFDLMDRLTPTRTLTATRTVIVTTTHETELTKVEFLSLTPADSTLVHLFGQATAMNLDRLAIEILNTYGNPFRDVPDVPALQTIIEVANAFNHEQFGNLMLSEFTKVYGLEAQRFIFGRKIRPHFFLTFGPNYSIMRVSGWQT